MEYFLDTANIKDIKKINDIFPIIGITTNPSIISKENRNFKEIIQEIQEILGKDKLIHIQVIGKTFEIMIEEVKLLVKTFGENIYAKIPVTEQGIKAMKELSKEGYKITATGILSPQQIIMAAEAGAEYMAPYINRSDNIGESGIEIVKDAQKILDNTRISDEECFRRYKRVFEPKIFGASFKNVRQVHEVMLAGAKSVTIGTEVFERLIYHPYTDWSIEKFESDWEKIYGDKNLLELIKK
ncbi:transaldolase family protein [Streptobacillus ratti]|uniref:transaldolase family protein n=1 Tax=Streptobacillus ratti TaxID=1720557 RepID=UPI00093314C7|nr:transaldolase family protein [Streptobacillus ratti]